MMIAPILFKTKAIRSLKGNWQTALLVTFFAGLLATAASIAFSVWQPQISLDTFLADNNLDALQAQMLAEVQAVPPSQWIIMGGLYLLSFLLTPMLSLGCNHYFIARIQGRELGFAGLFSRLRYVGKALWLSILMGVKVFLWSLLLLVPGIIASFRYSMAPYYLAQDPTLTACQALQKSKNAMQNTKLCYFMLRLSFLGWMFLSSLLLMVLGDVNPILSMVVYQFVDLFISTYMNGSFAAFFLVVSDPQGLEAMTRSMGISDLKAPLDDSPDEPSKGDGPSEPPAAT